MPVTALRSALGYDASSFEGYDFINKITNNTRMINQGVNGPLYSLIALNSGDYQVPENAQWTKEKLLEEILKYQGTDGGFSLALNSASDADMTAMTLIALAPYTDQSAIKNSRRESGSMAFHKSEATWRVWRRKQ